ncbi:MAG: universal stress protein, partial [Cyanobacteriota bacterium]|nr:universal stress protein [Cyanobacteriota bacterium]
ADIRYQFVFVTGVIPEEIIRIAQDKQVADIVMGKRGHRLIDKILVGSVSQAVLESSSIPVILVD